MKNIYIQKMNGVISQEKMKRILKIALPLMIQGLVFQMQSLTDKAFLGNIDTHYVSAIGAAQLPLTATMDSLVAISTGLIILVSRLYGADDKKGITKYVKSAIFYNSLISIALFFIWQTQITSILTFFQVSSEIMQYSEQYIRICSSFLLFLGLDSSLQAMLQGIGETRIIMYAGILKVGLNIFISWILIFGHFGFPALYVTGAAIGTLAANLCLMMFLFTYCFIVRRKEFGLYKNARLWFDRHSYGTIFSLGVPTGIEYLLWNGSNLILIRFINGFSYQDMAIYTITFGFQCIIYALFEGSSKAAMTLIGHSLGATDQKSASAFFRNSMILNFAIVLLACIVFCLCPSQLLGIFTKDTQIVTRGIPYLCFMGIIMLPQSMNIICGNGIRAYNDTKWMLYSQIIGSILVVGFSWYFVSIRHMGMMSIYFTIFLDETIRAGVNYVYYMKRYDSGRVRK